MRPAGRDWYTVIELIPRTAAVDTMITVDLHQFVPRERSDNG
ncbi:hypothetical protein Y013_04895 [Rhodococcus pyridinivorans SB3094]|uniref:Uncharacterized protein n=1 Tax=Rhodococcus pyridinivorans SB3094 TaxID=1435356 RepID=V9XJK1_9NOCA|nr:hypothetical protein Y013_04895 [Rhodococcus pyridinivorans SB3094]